MIWDAQDVRSARHAAWALLPLLTLKSGGGGCTLVLAAPHNGRPTFQTFQPLKGSTVPESAPASTDNTREAYSRSTAERDDKKSGRNKGGRTNVKGREVGRSVKQGRGRGGRVQPVPLRRVVPEAGKAPFEHRYRGEGPSERGAHTEGGSPSDTPLHLVQQVVRLGYDAAIVRVVLERDVCCKALHPTDPAGSTENRHRGDSQRSEECQVRCIVMAEAYLPGSSQTLTIRVRIPCNRSETEHSSTTNGKAVEDDTIECETSIGEMCESRQRQRCALKESREAEARNGVREIAIAIQEVGLRTQAYTGVSGERLNTQVMGNDKRRNNAFSILLVRANATVPVKRIDLGSGSWRDSVGELVGCPVGQELTSVRASAVLWGNKYAHCIVLRRG